MQSTLKHIKESLKGFYDESEIKSIARYIIEDATGIPLPILLSDKSKQFTVEQRASIDKIIQRLQNFEPLQYVLGYTEFYGLRFTAKEGVLIPRPETEELVDLVVKRHKYQQNNILDIGTGSGCIAISLAKNMNSSNIEGWDISEIALNIAEKNALDNNVSVGFRHIDVLNSSLKSKQFDIIVSNPPYVLESEKALMEKHVLDYEPHLALFVPDTKALLFYERIADLSKELLTPKGHLYFEINSMKGYETVNMLRKKGFLHIELLKDMSGNDRIVTAQL